MADYFPNKVVQALVIKYQDTGCTDVPLRDEIMQYVPELALKVIRRYTMYKLWGYSNSNTAQPIIDELVSLCWERIEKIIYKYDRTKKSSIFSQWTSVCILVVRAAAKNNGRHNLHTKAVGRAKMKQAEERGANLLWDKFKAELIDVRPTKEVRGIHEKCVQALLELEPGDLEAFHINKILVGKTGLKRKHIKLWLEWMRQNGSKFSQVEREPEELQLPCVDGDRS